MTIKQFRADIDDGTMIRWNSPSVRSAGVVRGFLYPLKAIAYYPESTAEFVFEIIDDKLRYNWASAKFWSIPSESQEIIHKAMKLLVRTSKDEDD